MTCWLHCNNKICAHEFYGKEGDRCDWCNAGSYVLQRLNAPPILQIAEEVFQKLENQRKMN